MSALSERSHIAACAALGAGVGALIFPSWHHAVESAQAVAGVVAYDRGNPFGEYHLRSWSLLHQVLAALLRVGVTERALSYLASGAVGALSYAALGAALRALGVRERWTVALPAFIHLTCVTDFGVTYPVWLMGHYSSYGVIGLSGALLALSLLALRRDRGGLFLLGALPCVHTLLGLYALALAALAAILTPSHRPTLRSAFRPLGAGFTLSAISLTAHLWSVSRTLGTASVPRAAYLPIARAFIDAWSSHGARFHFDSTGYAICAATTALAAAALRWRREDLSRDCPSATPLLTALVASGVVSTALAALSWIPARHLPLVVIQVVPSRFVNLSIVTFPVLSIALAHRLTRNGLAYALALCAPVALLAVRDPSEIKRGAAIGLVATALLALTRLSKGGPALPERVARAWPRALATALSLPLVVWAVQRTAEGETAHQFPLPVVPMTDRTNHPFYDRVSAGRGVLLADVDLAQLRTRRPVLMSRAINQLLYVPSSGPRINDILQSVYGLDLLRPPRSPMRREGTLHPSLYHDLWRRRTRATWLRIGAEAGFTQVLCGEGLALDLPVAARGDGMTLYDVR